MWRVVIPIIVFSLASGCSDDTTLADTHKNMDAQADLGQTDGQQTEDGKAGDGQQTKDGKAGDGQQNKDGKAGDGTLTTSCGTKTCNTASEMCVITEQMIGPKYDCLPVPTGCHKNRTCSCAKQLCTAPYNTCVDGASNTISCTCPSC